MLAGAGGRAQRDYSPARAGESKGSFQLRCAQQRERRKIERQVLCRFAVCRNDAPNTEELTIVYLFIGNHSAPHRLKTVTEQLTQMRQEQQKKKELYRLYEAEARKCHTLKREISQLKDSRAVLIRKQRDAAAELRRVKQEKMREMNGMKRADAKKQKLVKALEMEIKKKAAALDRKDKVREAQQHTTAR
jgi:hypothetical protein